MAVAKFNSRYHIRDFIKNPRYAGRYSKEEMGYRYF